MWHSDVNYMLVKPNVKDYYLLPWAVPKLRFVYLTEPPTPDLPLAPSLVTPASTQQPTLLEASGALNVTKTADTNDGACDSDCSLREAIGVASSGDNIVIPAGIYTLTLDDQLSIDKDLALIGAGSGRTIVRAAAVSGVAESRVFHVSGSDVSISGVTVQNGKVVIGSGGGILNDGGLKLFDIIVRDNLGGGISNSGVITLTNTIIVNNSASYGGGILNTGQATVVKTDISDNSASYWGGGIFNNEGTMTLTKITVNNNSAGYGGGIRNEYGTVTLIDSKISYNSASSGGGGILNNRGTVTIANTTISNNDIWNMKNEGDIIFLD